MSNRDLIQERIEELVESIPSIYLALDSEIVDFSAVVPQVEKKLVECLIDYHDAAILMAQEAAKTDSYARQLGQHIQDQRDELLQVYTRDYASVTVGLSREPGTSQSGCCGGSKGSNDGCCQN